MNKPRAEQAMTFLEVMAALSILAISLVVLLESQGRSIDLSSKANLIDSASLLGRMRMEELDLEVQQKGFDSMRDEERGEFDKELFPDFRWEYKIAKVNLPLAAGAAQEDQMQLVQGFMEQAIRQLNLTIFWKEGSQQRHLELVTHLVKVDMLANLTAGLPTSGSGGTTD